MTVRWVFAAFAVGWILVSGRAYAQEEPAGTAGSSEAPDTSEEPASDDGADDSGEGEGLSREQKMLNRELRTVEEEVNGLKERVFRSKATLQLLKELVIDGATGGARVTIRHVNEMSNNYSIESIQYFLDGKNVYTKVDPGGELAALKEMKIHEQGLPAGEHTLQVKLVLRGNGSGVFSYLNTYQFNVQSSYDFTVDSGKVSDLTVIATSRGGLRNFVDRPALRYEERTDTIREE